MSRNQLDQETSPYLLQHRDNPVFWRPWGPAALAEAADSGKPIMLSVGYAACHWCHVMAHESFEDAAIADLINSLFIPIKVDREERPDLDALYQMALAVLGQQGGWPLTMFLTPGGKPFWGGTYFPPSRRYGRPGFPEVLQSVANAWRDQTDKIADSVTAIEDALLQTLTPEAGPLPGPTIARQAARSLLPAVDLRRGGLKGAPKFPQSPLFLLMWRAALAEGDSGLKEAVLLSLTAMSQGGIYDHLGGGYARYSTDDDWLVPHFEKMLYDNAQILEQLTLAWQLTGSPLYARRIADSIGWLQREMLAEADGFAAALDADSEGEEGKYYVWSLAEVENLLPPAQRSRFCRTYNISAGGNWEGANILHLTAEDPAAEAELADCRAILLAARQKRIPPGRDDKVLADWNGMIIAALANAAFAFDRADWLALAERAFAGVTAALGDGERLSHSLCRGRKQPAAMLDDYANMARAALILGEITGRPDYAQRAAAWVAVADRHYWDDAGGGYFQGADHAQDLILRSKSAIDHATPSANGVMVEVLARLYLSTGEDRYRGRAEATVAAFAGSLRQSPHGLATLIGGWDYLNAATQVVVTGSPADRAPLLRAVAAASLPLRHLTQLDPGAVLPPGHPAFGKTTGPSAAAFVCRGTVCSLPVTDAAALRDALSSR
ncbi:MAG TPA: thioredoxin domain-containing protein [Rhodospirillaceae bacterium]|nr:thioredoxin domain-containing protein [Rhodospirillaceae bacterium]